MHLICGKTFGARCMPSANRIDKRTNFIRWISQNCDAGAQSISRTGTILCSSWRMCITLRGIALKILLLLTWCYRFTPLVQLPLLTRGCLWSDASATRAPHIFRVELPHCVDPMQKDAIKRMEKAQERYKGDHDKTIWNLQQTLYAGRHLYIDHQPVTSMVQTDLRLILTDNRCVRKWAHSACSKILEVQ